MEKYFIEKDNKKICYFGVIDNYIYFIPTKYTKKYRVYILKNVREVYNQLLKKHSYLYTISEDTKELNKWHVFIGLVLQEKIKYKNKEMNIWINK